MSEVNTVTQDASTSTPIPTNTHETSTSAPAGRAVTKTSTNPSRKGSKDSSSAASDTTAEFNARAKALPTHAQLAKAARLEVWDRRGQSVRFGDVVAEGSGDREGEGKTVVVFIRHFFCGMCQDYVTQLSTVPPAALAAARTRIIVVGCGDWQLIPAYHDLTSFPHPIYADPTRAVYRALGMTRESLKAKPSGEKERGYIRDGFWTGVWKSILRGPLRHPFGLGKQGNIAQLGGDFIITAAPGSSGALSCSMASRMVHTSDHMEVADLMAAAGVEYP